MKVYYLSGGVFTDTTFTKVLPTTMETFGPYNDYTTARKKWWELTCRNVDICEHRIFLTEHDFKENKYGTAKDTGPAYFYGDA